MSFKVSIDLDRISDEISYPKEQRVFGVDQDEGVLIHNILLGLDGEDHPEHRLMKMVRLLTKARRKGAITDDDLHQLYNV